MLVLGWLMGNAQLRANIEARALSERGAVWITIMTAAGRSAGNPLRRTLRASTPPAEAPMTMRSRLTSLLFLKIEMPVGNRRDIRAGSQVISMLKE